MDDRDWNLPKIIQIRSASYFYNENMSSSLRWIMAQWDTALNKYVHKERHNPVTRAESFQCLSALRLILKERGYWDYQEKTPSMVYVGQKNKNNVIYLPYEKGELNELDSTGGTGVYETQPDDGSALPSPT